MSTAGYQVIARKWRPQRFADVVGQAAVVRTLSNALEQQRVAHAYCFSGIRGVGKTTIARLLAKGLNCRAGDGPTADPCGRCESCVEIEASRSIDVLERDAASERGIEEMRQLIEVSRYAPSRDRRKVFILDEAHMLTAEASNALLKVLEEPPPWIVFMLATTEPNKILPTILSRCQHYQLGRIAQGEIVGHLGKIAAAEGVQISADGLALLATAADGSLRDGQSLLDKLIAFAGEEIDEGTVVDLLGLVDRVLLFRATELLAAGDVAGTLRFVDEMVDSGVNLHQFTVDLLGHFRNLLVVRSVDDAAGILHLPEGDIERLREQADGFSIDDLDRAFSTVAANEYRIKSSEQPRYHLEVMLARLARMPTLEPIADLLAELRGEGGGGRGGATGSGGGGARRGRPGAGAPSAAMRDRPRAPERKLPAPPAPVPPAPAPTAPVPTPARPQPDPEPAPRPAPTSRPEAPEPAPPTAAPEPALDPEPTTTTPATAATPASADAAADTDDDQPMPALLRKIQEQIEKSHPLIAQVLDRCGGISVAGERLDLQFATSNGIFVQRLRDPEVLQLLGRAASEVTGRRVVARVEMSASVSARPRPARPDPSLAESPEAAHVTEAAPPSDDAPETGDVPEVETTANGDSPSGDADREALLRRAEQEPRVQEFVKALKGQIVSVEELRDR